MQKEEVVILGAGVTGLAAGIKTRAPIFEAHAYPGGICHSYQKNGYHFEVGGGHWLFGGERKTLDFVGKLTRLKSYTRNSAVFFADKELYVPYPIQNHLEKLPLIKKISMKSRMVKPATFADRLEKDFGQALCRLFFFPFNDAYTAGLYKKIAPQDQFKNPTSGKTGYNQTFAYPKEGLDSLIKKMASRCQIFYDKKVIKIDVRNRLIHFADGTVLKYASLISTLPLNLMVKLTGLNFAEPPPPYNSTLVINIGAKKGKKFPGYHWLYLPQSRSGFYRVGFYSNIDSFFLPRGKKNRAALYVELSFPGGRKPGVGLMNKNITNVIRELEDYQFISQPEVVDPTWVEVAYTWSWPGSVWREKALTNFEKQGIHQIGRYGRWHFQGILESIKEGLSWQS